MAEILEVINNKKFKYEYKPLQDKMPITKIKKKYWFLYELVNDEWFYLGAYETKKEMIGRMNAIAILASRIRRE